MKHFIAVFYLLTFPLTLMAKVISGYVCNMDKEPIPLANVTLCHKSDSLRISSTTTNNEGFFEMDVKDTLNCFLRVSCVGYQPQDVTITGTSMNIMLIYYLLNEVVISADLIKRDASTDVFYITDSLRSGCANTLQLLNRLKGVHVDLATECIKIGEYRDVPIVIDGKDVSAEYVRNINPKRIRKVEILRNPKGKYGDLPIVVNIILNNSYTGFDLGIHAKGMVSLKNKHSRSKDEGLTLSYSKQRWNIYGDAGVKYKRVFEAASYEDSFNGDVEKTAMEDSKHPNIMDDLKSVNFSVGTDYKISKTHTVSFQALLDKKRHSNESDYNDTTNCLLSQTFRNYNTSDITTGFFYRGNIDGKMYLSSDVTFNYYDVKENNNYVLLDNSSTQLYKGEKNYWRVNAEAKYIWNDILSSTIGYSFTKKDYNNFDRQTNSRLFSSGESRHDTYFSVSYNPSKNFNFILGSNFLNVGETSDNISHWNSSWMPLAKAYWRPLKRLSILMNYFCEKLHPNLDQLSTVTYQRHKFLWQKGNPELKAQILHYLQFRVNLKDIMEITYLYKYSSNEFSPWYYTDEDRAIETIANGDYIHQYVGFNGDYVLPNNIGINFTANYQWYKRQSAERDSRRNGHTWYLDVTASWSVSKRVALVSEYFLRYDKEPLLQGKKYGQNEQLMFGAQISVLNNKMSIFAVATIPTKVISKRCYNEILIPKYHYMTWNDDRVNNSIVQVVLRYNISKGKVSKLQYNNNNDKEK